MPATLTRRRLLALTASPRWGKTNGQTSQSQIGSALYPETDGEVAAGVSPAYRHYPPGNVLRYGADPTGAIDSTAAFQACHDSGKVLFMPIGRYLLDRATTTAAFQISKSDFYMYGHGPDSQIIHNETGDVSGNVAVIEVRPLHGDIDGLYFSDFRITGASPSTGATPNNASSLKCQGIIFNTSTREEAGHITTVVMRNVIIEKMGFSCFTINGSNIGGRQYYCAQMLFQGCIARNSRQDGFNIDAGFTYDVIFDNCIASGCDGIGHEHAGAGWIIDGGLVENCAAGVATDYNAAAIAALMRGTSPYKAPGIARTVVRGATIAHCYTKGSPATPGIAVSESTPALYLTIEDNDISQCGGHGIIFNQLGSYCDVVNNRIRDVGSARPNTYSGIHYGNVQTHSTCTGNVCDTTTSGFSMQSGIHAAVGPHVRFAVAGNTVNNAQSANYRIPSAGTSWTPSFLFRRGIPPFADNSAKQTWGSRSTVLSSLRLPANTLEAANQTVKVTAWGTCNANGNTKTIDLHWDGAVLMTLKGAQNGGSWRIEATIMVAMAGTSGTVVYSAKAEPFNGALVSPNSAAITSVDLADEPHTVECRGTGSITGDIVQTGFLLEFPDTY